ncbi:MAG: aspartate aminotransferase family protein [Gammaproteobacteria bacterium]|nr:aspartate aminotransferase family protein [Gammaproteobacteria bacterium]|tara:strand:+ start:94873 stop:96042 length:1170 start_codon:yes stop_codon:yes gene_type:complete
MNNHLMPTYKRKDVSFVRGDGVYLWDTEGKKYIDALSGLAVTNLGHSNLEITQVLTSQSQELIHTSNAFNITNQEKLAEKLCKLTCMEKAFFCNSGTEAVEAALKIAKKHANDKNVVNPKIISMNNGFHGRTLGALSATFNGKAQDGFEPLLEGFCPAPYNNSQWLIDFAKDNNNVVAVLLESIQGEGGIIIPDSDYLENVRKICDTHGWLMLVDEVQSGFCRTGKWFGYQHSNILPDVVMLAKALGNGVPIGVCLAKGEAAGTLTIGDHGSTFGGNFLSTAVGLKVVEIMENQSICKHVTEIGKYFSTELQKKLKHYKIIKEIRSKGLMVGIELNKESTNLAIDALKIGLVINITRGNIIRLLPPLIIKKEHVDEIIEKISLLLKNYE